MFLALLIVCLALNTHNLTKYLLYWYSISWTQSNIITMIVLYMYYFLIFHKQKNWFQIVNGKCVFIFVSM